MPQLSHEQAILNAGLRVFHQHGFNASGVQDIVTDAGVPKGSFYNHFPSKDALGVAVLERYWDLAESMRTVLKDASMAPLDRIDRHFEMFDCIDNGCLLGNFSAELAMHDQFRDALIAKWGAWIEALARCLTEGQQAGSVRTDTSALALARVILAQFEGAILMARVERNSEALVAARHAIRRLASA